MSEPVSVYGPCGGPGGQEFGIISPASVLAGVRVRHGAFIDAVGAIWSDGNDVPDGSEVQMHGGPGGECSTLIFPPGDRLVQVSGRSGTHVDALQFTFASGHHVTFGGNDGHCPFRFSVPDGWRLGGLLGRAGTYLDALGVVLVPDLPARSGGVKGAVASLVGRAGKTKAKTEKGKHEQVKPEQVKPGKAAKPARAAQPELPVEDGDSAGPAAKRSRRKTPAQTP